MAQRAKYWSCTKFADWLRGNQKPTALTWSGWRVWNKESKQRHPFRYWLAEDVLDTIQDTLWWPLDTLYDIKYYINNRFITRTNSLTAHPRDIKPGNWCDVGNRFLPCLFNELVDYVEMELAWWHIAWEGKEARKKYNAPFWATGWFRLRTWRCPQAGLDNLEWQSNLRWTEEEVGDDDERLGKPTQQAENAKEILALYQWWTTVYAKRVDPHEASGWTALCSKARLEDGIFFDRSNQTEEEKQEVDRILKLSDKIELEYKNEDTEMLIRLIKIRDALWT